MALAGPCAAYLLSAVLHGGKTIKNGKLDYAGCIRSVRVKEVGTLGSLCGHAKHPTSLPFCCLPLLFRHKDPRLCAHGALGRHLVVRFNGDTRSEPFPDPDNDEVWCNTALWPGVRPDSNIGYAALLTTVSRYLEVSSV